MQNNPSYGQCLLWFIIIIQIPYCFRRLVVRCLLNVYDMVKIMAFGGLYYLLFDLMKK